MVLPDNKISIGTVGTTTINLKGKMGTRAGFFNAYYDVKEVHKYLVPYISAGIGIAQHKFRGVRYTADNVKIPIDAGTVFAWKVGIGAMYKLSHKLALDGSYQYADLGSVRGYSDTATIFSGFRRQAHMFSLSLQYKF
jgi:opacity protein-like surface antigen